MTTKRIELTGLFITLIVFSLWMGGCTSIDNTPVSMGELDKLNLITLDSTQFEYTKSDMRGSLLVVVYNPSCEHCQAEAQEFYQNMDKLMDVTLLMIGSVPLKELKDFSQKYGLDKFANVKFAYASPVATYNLLHVENLPYSRLYDKHFKPVKEFVGTTPVNTILSHVKG